jgi:hypothetical protein
VIVGEICQARTVREPRGSSLASSKYADLLQIDVVPPACEYAVRSLKHSVESILSIPDHRP